MNDTKIIEFPFRMNWIAAVHGGEIILEIFWDAVDAMNDIAIKGRPMTKTDIENITYLNSLFVNWDLPVFPVPKYSPIPFSSFPNEKVIPLPR